MQHSGQEITKDGETPQSARFWKLLLQVGGPAAGPRESAREKDHHGERFNPSGVSRSIEGNVQLSVGEDRSRQVDGDFLEGLSLRFIDGHREGRPDRKLAPTKLDGNGLAIGVGVHVNPGDTDHVPYVTAREDFGLNDRAK